jgi:hypothetical protein
VHDSPMMRFTKDSPAQVPMHANAKDAMYV